RTRKAAPTKKAPEGAFFVLPRGLLALLVLILADLVADHAADLRAADRTDRAAASGCPADRAASDCAAHGALGLTRNTLLVEGFARGQADRCEGNTDCKKNLAHVMPPGCKK